MAAGADGDFVIAWQSDGQDGSSYGIYAQRYNASGAALSGEFRVNTFTTLEQVRAAVAKNADGDFVIAWQSNLQDGHGYGVYARQYSAAGVALSDDEFLVNNQTSNAQRLAAVAADADGDFVITWHSSLQDGSGYGVYAQRYNAAGVAQGGEFRISTTTAGNQQRVSVAMDADGDYVVVWQSAGQDGSGEGMFAQRFARTAVVEFVNANGQNGEMQPDTLLVQVVPAGTALRVAFSRAMSAAGGVGGANSVSNPANWSLSVDPLGNPVTITSVNVIGVLAELTLSAPLTAGRYTLTAKGTICDADGHFFDGDFDGTFGGDYAITFDVKPTVTAGDEFRVNTYTTAGQRTNLRTGAVAADADGNFVVVWASNGQDGSGYGVYAQRYNAAGVAQGGEFRVNTYTTSHQVYSSVAMDADGDFVISWSSSGQDGSGYGIYAQRYNAAGVAQGSEFRVNTSIANSQSFSSVAMDAAGDFVISWRSNGQDGSDYGIYAQRYNAAGVAQGGEFQVNSYTTGQQRLPNVAMDAAGDFVITWESDLQDGSGYGIYAQRFNAAGVTQGGEFKVNTFTTNNQRYSSVAMDADGDFVISWMSYGQDGSDYGIYAHRYNAAGVAQGEFKVNTYTTNGQLYASVAMDADGDFVISWTTTGPDGSNQGIYAKRYNAAGVTQGNEFQVNTYTTSDQRYASVAMSAAGDFVVVWTSGSQDGNGEGVYAQRYEADRLPSTTGLPNVLWTANGPDIVVNLAAHFNDFEDGPGGLTYTIQANTNSGLFTSTTINGADQLVLDVGGSADSADVTVRATDASGEWVESTFTVTLNHAVAINPPTLAGGLDGQAYSQTVSASRGTGPLTLTLSGALPPGLVFDPSSGLIDGTLLAPGAFTFTVTATDAVGASASQQYTVKVVPETLGLVVQNGMLQRSFVNTLDFHFESSIVGLVGASQVRLQRFDLNGGGAPVTVGLAGVVSIVSDHVHLDFGAQGVGGNRNTNAGDGYYELGLDLDNDGAFETVRHFYRLLGDVSGDRTVNVTDANLIFADYGTIGAGLEHDANGDGAVNAVDRGLTVRANGRSLNAGLPLASNPPLAHAGGPYTIEVGGSLLLDASGSQPNAVHGGAIVSYRWDLNNDGAYDITSTTATVLVDWATIAALLPAVSGVDNPIALRVADAQGSAGLAATTLTMIEVQRFAALTVSPETPTLDVQREMMQRSFIQHIELTFAEEVSALTAAGRLQLLRFGLDGGGGGGTALDLTGQGSVQANRLHLDFGGNGLDSDGYYRLGMDLDGDGVFETVRAFYRLRGDVNGDRVVDGLDEAIIAAALGRSSPGQEADVNGDSAVDALDQAFAALANGRALAVGLHLDD